MNKTDIRRETKPTLEIDLSLLDCDLWTRAYQVLGLTRPGAAIADLCEIDRAMAEELDRVMVELNVPSRNKEDVDRFKDARKARAETEDALFEPKLTKHITIESLILIAVSFIGVMLFNNQELSRMLPMTGLTCGLVLLVGVTGTRQRFVWRRYSLTGYPGPIPDCYVEQMIQIGQRLSGAEFFVERLEKTSCPIISVKYGEERIMGVFDETDFPTA